MMNKLMIALIAGTFAAATGAQTGTVAPASVGDHGTPAMHAAEAKKNVEASKAVSGLPADAKAKQQVVKDVTTTGGSSSAGAVASAKGAAAAKAGAGTPKALPTTQEKREAVTATTKANASQ
jgi:hypothetical protein